MNKQPYTIYLASKPISGHDTFDEALLAYRMHSGKRGLNMRNGERSDVDDNGLTEDERAQLEAV